MEGQQVDARMVSRLNERDRARKGMCRANAHAGLPCLHLELSGRRRNVPELRASKGD